MKKKIMICLCLLLAFAGCSIELEKIDVPRETIQPSTQSLQSAPADEDIYIEPEAPAPTEAPALTAQEERQLRAEELLSGLTLEQKVGQLFFVHCPGPLGDGAALMEQYQLGGYLLFKRDFQDAAGRWATADQLKTRLESYGGNMTIPPLLGVDEEGGRVCRASQNPNLFPEGALLSPQNLYKQGGMPAISKSTAYRNDILLQLGINVNFAPVADVTTSAGDYMYTRAFGQEAEATSQYVQTVTALSSAQGMGAVLKHFPGYGNNVDTHTGIAVDKRPYEQFLQSDLLPFRAGAVYDNAAVLVSHNIVNCLDESLPASLSPAVYQLLREELAFDGVAITDDLIMDAVSDYSGEGQAALKALQAGADMVILSDPEIQVPRVLQAVEQGELSQARVDEAALRVLKWKLALGLME